MSNQHNKAHVQPTQGRNEVIQEEMKAQPHIQKHRARPQSLDAGSADSPVYRNDEAFLRFEMGQEDTHQPSKTSKPLTQDLSVEMNHHARGGAKERSKNTLRKEYMEDLKPT